MVRAKALAATYFFMVCAVLLFTFAIFVSMIDLTSPSPAEKMQRYMELNTPTANSYATYLPTPTAVPPAINTPSIDFTSMLSNTTVPYSPLLRPTKSQIIGKDTNLTASDFKDSDDLPKANTTPSMANSPLAINNLLKRPSTAGIPYKAPNLSTNMKTAYKYLVQDKNLPTHVAAGIVGNLYQESGLDPLRKQNDGGNGRGIAQWDVRDRWPAFQKWATKQGRDYKDLKTQLDYMLVEPGEGPRAVTRTMGATSPQEAAVIFGRLYERPSESAARWDIRKGVAQTLDGTQIQ